MAALDTTAKDLGAAMPEPSPAKPKPAPPVVRIGKCCCCNVQGKATFVDRPDELLVDLKKGREKVTKGSVSTCPPAHPVSPPARAPVGLTPTHLPLADDRPMYQVPQTQQGARQGSAKAQGRQKEGREAEERDLVGDQYHSATSSPLYPTTAPLHYPTTPPPLHPATTSLDPAKARCVASSSALRA